jgi:hypothetical protein
MTKAMPLSLGMCSKNDLTAWRPPAEAPMPTTGKGKVLGISSLRCGTLGERFTEDVMIKGLNGMLQSNRCAVQPYYPMFSAER